MMSDMVDGPKVVGRIGGAPPEPPKPGPAIPGLVVVPFGSDQIGVGMIPEGTENGAMVEVPGVVMTRGQFEEWVFNARKIRGWW